jgi:hypothetical protein
MGPVVSAAFGRLTADDSKALSYAMLLAAGGLIISAIYLWHEVRRQDHMKERCHD